MNFTIETVSGVLIDPLNPSIEDLKLEDAAWAISRINRYAGHTVTKVPYNVAQHCCFVADMIWDQTKDPELSLFGLLHDVGEAFTGDIPSPVKKIPELKAVIEPIEDRLLQIMYEKYIGRSPTEEEETTVKYYDRKALFIEAYNFMSSRGLNWTDRNLYHIDNVELQNFPLPIESTQSYNEYMLNFEFYKDM